MQKEITEIFYDSALSFNFSFTIFVTNDIIDIY